jgi:hypothetical protein
MIRKGYAYYWQGKDRFGGEVVDISEEDYKKVHQIFESAEYTKEFLASKEQAKPEESKTEESPKPVVEESSILESEKENSEEPEVSKGDKKKEPKATRTRSQK